MFLGPLLCVCYAYLVLWQSNKVNWKLHHSPCKMCAFPLVRMLHRNKSDKSQSCIFDQHILFICVSKLIYIIASSLCIIWQCRFAWLELQVQFTYNSKVLRGDSGVLVVKFSAGCAVPGFGCAVLLQAAGVPGLRGGVSGSQLGELALLLQGLQTHGHLQRHDTKGTAGS